MIEDFLFLSVDSIVFICLQQSHAPNSLCLYSCFPAIKKLEIAKTKSALEAVCTPTLKSVLGQETPKLSYKKLCVICVYLRKCCVPY